MDASRYLEQAKRLLDGARTRTLSVEERREAAIELAALMLNEARRIQTSYEHRQHAQIDRMLEDPQGKIFSAKLTDECFRSRNPARVVDQIHYLIKKFGVPKFLTYMRQLELLVFKMLGSYMPKLFAPMAKRMLRKETSTVILPGERKPLVRHLERRKREGVRTNLNQLGEAVLGEEEAEGRLRTYLEDLNRPEVEYISVKVSTLCSQLNLVAWNDTVAIIEKRLKELYRAAMRHTYVRPNGKCVPKFVNLDMEEYRDLHLTVELFRRTLEDPEFYRTSAGIVLQSYLPDSYLIQQELTVWAMQRVANGGAPIKIRIVKGANLAMEKVEASLRGWPQSPYPTKADVDANYKRMLTYAFTPDHARAAHVGIGSHNLFDIAYALLLRSELGVEKYVEFEMLEGMVDHIRRVVQELSGDMLLYCPAAKEKEFTTAVAYLLRRLDENSAPENFLRHAFGLIPGTKEWQEQVNHFSLACHAANAISLSPRKTQSRFHEPAQPDINSPFSNEPDTDWSLPQNRKWIQGLLEDWKKRDLEDVPLVIGGKEIPPDDLCGIGRDPSCPNVELYRYKLADGAIADKALKAAEKAQKKWGALPVAERSTVLAKLAQLLRLRRGELIGAMIADGGKTIPEADVEVSEAVDLVEYYRRTAEEYSRMEDVLWSPKGTALVVPPWNFPCSIPIGGVAAALAAGNCVIFKPALETAYVGWKLASLCWEAGIEKDVLQFILCQDDPVGSQLVQDPRVSCVVLTGSTETAKMFLKMRPGIDLLAETGGKNTLILTGLCDRDQAVRDLVHSAFGHSGQKCSACSLAICETEVYNDRHFRKTLRDAVSSLKVGSAWDPSSRLPPLIHEPNETLLKGLTTLDEGEEWLLEPKQDLENPNLWSPGIKIGVREGSFTHQNELFGPVLGIMRADTLEDAVRLANSTRYGLTAGIHTLDEREQEYWKEHIMAGNCYVNRGITGAIVQRQPFGGCKESSFGPGSKAGGPNYVVQLMKAEQASLPTQTDAPSGQISLLTTALEKAGLSRDDMEVWKASVGSYAYHWNKYFSQKHDPSKLLGQDNILKYAPHEKVVLRVNSQDGLLDVVRVIAASLTAGMPLEVSGSCESMQFLKEGEWLKLAKGLSILVESEEEFINRFKQNGGIKRARFISAPSLKLKQTLGEAACNTSITKPLANGRLELLHYVREVSLSVDYHRYGNLGQRENEVRSPNI